MKQQNTYDRQTAKFLSVVGENMPEMLGDVMQSWIENPEAVQKVLFDAFCLPEFIIITDDATKKTSEIVSEMRKLFPVSVYDEENLDTNFPTPKVSTSRKFLLTQEADENLKNLSANDLTRKGIVGITLRERLFCELDYFKRTKRHLDIKNITLCSGSRHPYGRVPSVYWDGDEVSVDWCHPAHQDDNLRSRAVVS